MNEYKGLISNAIFKSYFEILVIDIISDKLFKYRFNNNSFECSKISTYSDYLVNCKEFISSDDIDKYIEALSISNLENSNNINVSYKMMNDGKLYNKYNSNISLYNKNGQKVIIVLTQMMEETISVSKKVESNVEIKLNKVVDAVGMAMLKIHNIINNDSNSDTKREYIDSILSGLTNDFPEFNEILNNNAMDLYDNAKTTIMIIDDDKMTCNLIKKIFDSNYNVLTFNNGKEAIDYFEEGVSSNRGISCIFLDLLMPVLDGFSVLDYLNDHNFLAKIPVIIISGNYDKETRNKAYSYQIADMLEKPFNVQVVRHRIENLINLYRSSNSLNNMMLEQHKELKDIVNSLIVEYEHDYNSRMKMVNKYTHLLALQVSTQYPEYHINSNMIDKLSASASYYAIGNCTLPKTITSKKGVYTEEERSIIKMANINGASIVKYVLSKNNDSIDGKYCYEIAKYYNERYDGHGYPEGISGNSIPLTVQIASIAIEYCNLVNSIVPLDYEKIASLIVMESGRKFNPKIVDSFKKVQSEFEAITKTN